MSFKKQEFFSLIRCMRFLCPQNTCFPFPALLLLVFLGVTILFEREISACTCAHMSSHSWFRTHFHQEPET